MLLDSGAKGLDMVLRPNQVAKGDLPKVDRNSIIMVAVDGEYSKEKDLAILDGLVSNHDYLGIPVIAYCKKDDKEMVERCYSQQAHAVLPKAKTIQEASGTLESLADWYAYISRE